MQMCKCNASTFFPHASKLQQAPVGFNHTVAVAEFEKAVREDLKYVAPRHVLMVAKDIIAHRHSCEHFLSTGKGK